MIDLLHMRPSVRSFVWLAVSSSHARAPTPVLWSLPKPKYTSTSYTTTRYVRSRVMHLSRFPPQASQTRFLQIFRAERKRTPFLQDFRGERRHPFFSGLTRSPCVCVLAASTFVGVTRTSYSRAVVSVWRARRCTGAGECLPRAGPCSRTRFSQIKINSFTLGDRSNSMDASCVPAVFIEFPS
jgi:hypothetical protein